MAWLLQLSPIIKQADLIRNWTIWLADSLIRSTWFAYHGLCRMFHKVWHLLTKDIHQTLNSQKVCPLSMAWSRLWYLQCICTGDTRVLHQAIDKLLITKRHPISCLHGLTVSILRKNYLIYDGTQLHFLPILHISQPRSGPFLFIKRFWSDIMWLLLRRNGKWNLIFEVIRGGVVQYKDVLSV